MCAGEDASSQCSSTNQNMDGIPFCLHTGRPKGLVQGKNFKLYNLFQGLLILYMQGVGPTALRAAVLVSVLMPTYDLTKMLILKYGIMEDHIGTHIWYSTLVEMVPVKPVVFLVPVLLVDCYQQLLQIHLMLSR